MERSVELMSCSVEVLAYSLLIVRCGIAAIGAGDAGVLCRSRDVARCVRHPVLLRSWLAALRVSDSWQVARKMDRELCGVFGYLVREAC
jgi:hypothetical protein